ncbi:MAG TPA: zinc ribbon domain-containing protein [Rubrivivax sp.]|nr:zinc ribbon domain-containing protein [Rubrivivax sp.]
MKRHLIILAITALVSVAVALVPAFAQSEAPQLATWDVQLWPEYDEPSVLVIITGAVVEGATLPQTLRIPLPAGARLHAVAYPDATGNLLTLPWTTEGGADGQTVVFDLNQPRFVVEYYADILSPPPSRSFELNLVAPYAAQQASLALRQPSRASDLQVTPAMTAGGPDNLGNPTYTLELGALQAGQRVPVQVSYTKADADPSVAGLAVAETPVASVDRSSGWVPWVIGAALGLAAGAVVVYFLLRRRSTGASRQARRRQARKQGAPARPPVASPAAGSSQTKFCVQCGQKFEGNDRFCRNCGAARR